MFKKRNQSKSHAFKSVFKLDFIIGLDAWDEGSLCLLIHGIMEHNSS